MIFSQRWVYVLGNGRFFGCWEDDILGHIVGRSLLILHPHVAGHIILIKLLKFEINSFEVVLEEIDHDLLTRLLRSVWAFLEIGHYILADVINLVKVQYFVLLFEHHNVTA